MFHKAKTEADRQKIFDEYLLGILKKKKVIKINKKIIDESGFSFDPNEDNQQLKGAFNNYVDTLIVKNYMIEQLQTKLKISKSLSTQFVNKLTGDRYAPNDPFRLPGVLTVYQCSCIRQLSSYCSYL